MIRIRSAERRSREATIPELHNGDHLTQKEFHRRYEAMPKHVKAELIGGIVYMASPQRMPHSKQQDHLATARVMYGASTPGVESAGNATTILSEESEPQPDGLLRLLPEVGGQSVLNDEFYLVGAPESTFEVAHSSVNVDLFEKKEDYRKAGVREYAVFCIQEREIHWFDLVTGKEIPPDAKGIYRSKVFPGLWIDGQAILNCDYKRWRKVLEQGLKSPEHARFVKELQRRRRKRNGT